MSQERGAAGAEGQGKRGEGAGGRGQGAGGEEDKGQGAGGRGRRGQGAGGRGQGERNLKYILPISPSPHLPISPSPHLPISPSPHLPLAPCTLPPCLFSPPCTLHPAPLPLLSPHLPTSLRHDQSNKCFIRQNSSSL